jgi:hypothetical protein
MAHKSKLSKARLVLIARFAVVVMACTSFVVLPAYELIAFNFSCHRLTSGVWDMYDIQSMYNLLTIFLSWIAIPSVTVACLILPELCGISQQTVRIRGVTFVSRIVAALLFSYFVFYDWNICRGRSTDSDPLVIVAIASCYFLVWEVSRIFFRAGSYGAAL